MGIDVVTLALAKKYADQKNANKNTQADWNQNNKNATDFIKNRTHYDGMVPVSMAENILMNDGNDNKQSCTFAPVGYLADRKKYFHENSQIRVVLNGVEHIYDPQEILDKTSSSAAIYNFSVNGQNVLGAMSLKIHRQSGCYEFSLSLDNCGFKIIGSAYYEYYQLKKLDSKFLELPDDLATVDDIQAIEDIANMAQTTAYNSVSYIETQDLTDEQKMQARDNIGIVQSNWTQNDETSADYIKNRPGQPFPTIYNDNYSEYYDVVDLRTIPKGVFYRTDLHQKPPMLGVVADDGSYKIIAALQQNVNMYSEHIIYIMGDESRISFHYNNNDYSINATNAATSSDITLSITYNSRYLHTVTNNQYTPTKDYHPATKKYVDDAVKNIGIDDIILKSSTIDSNKQFRITVDDSGTLSAVEVV